MLYECYIIASLCVLQSAKSAQLSAAFGSVSNNTAQAQEGSRLKGSGLWGSMFMGGWAVALIIRIKGVTRPNIGVVYFVLCLCWCAVIVQKSEVLKMLKDQWNVIVYYSHPLVCDAIGRRHPARFMPKGEWFCGVLCILGMPPH